MQSSDKNSLLFGNHKKSMHTALSLSLSYLPISSYHLLICLLHPACFACTLSQFCLLSCTCLFTCSQRGTCLQIVTNSHSCDPQRHYLPNFPFPPLARFPVDFRPVLWVDVCRHFLLFGDFFSRSRFFRPSPWQLGEDPIFDKIIGCSLKRFSINIKKKC